jgi:nucleoside-diphosphate-sugar epimerase
MKRVLVTGASGCIGRHVLPRLTARGWEVWGLSSKTATPDVPGVRWRHANLLDDGDVAGVMHEVQPTHLLHLAWYIAPGKWAAAPENFEWVRASLNLVTAFRDLGGSRLVTAGSCLEYDWNYGYCSEARTPCAPHTVYGTCKHALQLLTSAMAANSGFSSAWGRVFFLYGPHEHPDRLVASVIRSVLTAQAARTSHGTQVRDYLYVEDVADVFVRLLESELTGPVNVASGQAVALRDIIWRIGELTGRRDLIQLGAIPPAATDTPLVVADTTRLRAELGWTPAWDLGRGLGATIDWWRANMPALAREHS